MRHVALLRAVNLGPSRRVGMAELRALAGRLGYRDATTLLQSGNLVFDADASADTVARDLEEALAAELGLDVPIVVRTAAELKRVVARDPFAEVATDGARYLVTFLSERLRPEVARGLGRAGVAPERLAVSGREIYLWLPDGVQRSRATRLLRDDKLGVVATARNWNTVKKLLELVERR